MAFEFPCEKGTCIINKTPCNFFKARQKDDKVVFIIAPSSMSQITGIVKRVILDAQLEPFVAVERTEGYGDFAFCQNVCEPILKSSIVVVIGDWRGNQGNVNAAYEFGIAKAFGSEMIPVSEEGGPFDMAMLHSIILPSDWRENPVALAEFETRLKAAFDEKRKEIQLRELLSEISPAAKVSIDELMSRFDDPTTGPERELSLKILLRNLQGLRGSDQTPYRYDRYVSWIIRLVADYDGGRVSEDILRIPFCTLLENTVTDNIGDPDSPIISDDKFHSALARIVLDGKKADHTRKTALRSLMEIWKATSKPIFLPVVATIVKDTSILGESYDRLNIPKLIAESVLNIGHQNPGQLFEFLNDLACATDRTVAKRYENIHNAANSP